MFSRFVGRGESWRRGGFVALLMTALLVVAACGSGAKAVSPGKAKDVVNFAEPAADTPNWIWPFTPAANLSIVGIEFQELMFRPLYLFGANGKTGVSESLSLAQLPSYSNGGKTATIALKNYKWSNGESVNASDVLFWIHMEEAEKAHWLGYIPGYFPDNIVSATASGPNTVVITMDKAYNPTWMVSNELSQITPMPAAWDATGPGQPSDCAANVADCPAVYQYLSTQSKDLQGYGSSPVWGIVDGPWKLKSFTTAGDASFVPNQAYSGPTKPTLKQFNMLPFTTEPAEFNVLRSGSTLDVGYLPTSDLTQAKSLSTSPDTAGPNPVSNYTLAPWFAYAINFFPMNFNNPTYGPVFKQLYFRQAMQSLVNQPGILKQAARNYGVQTIGPVPLYPQSDLISSAAKHNPYPFSIATAKRLLTENGWNVVPGGATTCAKPGTGNGECGADIPAGMKLDFTLPYASGQPAIQTSMESFKSNAARIGVSFTLSSAPFDAIDAEITPCSGAQCTWTFGNWGGWVYGPNYLPTGELMWDSGSLSNAGSFDDPQVDSLINESITETGNQAFLGYENALIKASPVIWQPDYDYQLTEIGGGLKGVTPQDPYAILAAGAVALLSRHKMAVC
ncbi:MAG: ABC transporter substrate-binding protein [Candidatus Dormibacteraceae bacterium]